MNPTVTNETNQQIPFNVIPAPTSVQLNQTAFSNPVPANKTNPIPTIYLPNNKIISASTSIKNPKKRGLSVGKRERLIITHEMSAKHSSVIFINHPICGQCYRQFTDSGHLHQHKKFCKKNQPTDKV